MSHSWDTLQRSFHTFLTETRVRPHERIIAQVEELLREYFEAFLLRAAQNSASNALPRESVKKLRTLMHENEVHEVQEFMFFGVWEGWRGMARELRNVEVVKGRDTRGILWREENVGEGDSVLDKIQWLRNRVLRSDFTAKEMERILRREKDWISRTWQFLKGDLVKEPSIEVEQGGTSKDETKPLGNRQLLTTFTPLFPSYADRYADLASAVELHEMYLAHHRESPSEDHESSITTTRAVSPPASPREPSDSRSFSSLLQDILDPLTTSLFNPLIDSEPYFPNQRELLLFRQEKQKLNALLNNPSISNTDKEKALAAYRQSVFYMLRDIYR